MPTNSKQKGFIARLKKQHRDFMRRRPHRTFQLTRRRDAVRPLELPGYISFTHEVNTTLWRYRKIFLLLALIYALLYGVLVGIQSQDTLTQLSESLKDAGSSMEDGNWGALEQAGALFVSIATTGISSDPTEVQQVFSVFVFVLVWLTTVWLLRNLLAGHKVTLRDGIYNSGSPIFAMVLILLLVAVQLIPIAIAAIGYSAALSSGLLAGGVQAMAFWVAAALLGVLSLYWITSSLFAMIIVTIPGMYPYQAIKTAGDLVLGRRVKLLLRWLWMALIVTLAWALVILAVVFLDTGLKTVWPNLQAVPLIPITMLVMSSIVLVWASAYVYLLYRKVVEYVPE